MIRIKGEKGGGVSSPTNHLACGEGAASCFDSTPGSWREEGSIESDAVIEGLVEELCYFDDTSPEHSTCASSESETVGEFVRNEVLDDRFDSERHEGRVSVEMRIEQGESRFEQGVALLLKICNDHINCNKLDSVDSRHNSCVEKIDHLPEKQSEERKPVGPNIQGLINEQWNVEGLNASGAKSVKDAAIEEGIEMRVGFCVGKEDKGKEISHNHEENELKAMDSGVISSEAAVPIDAKTVAMEECLTEGDCGVKNGLQHDNSFWSLAVDTCESQIEEKDGTNVGEENPHSSSKNEGNDMVPGEVETSDKSIAASRTSVQNEIRKCFVDAFTQLLTQGGKASDIPTHPTQHSTKKEPVHLQEKVCVVGMNNAPETHVGKKSMELEEGDGNGKVLQKKGSSCNVSSSNPLTLDLENIALSCGDSPEVSSGLYEDAAIGMGGKSGCISNNMPDSNAPSMAVSSNVKSVAIKSNPGISSTSFSSPVVHTPLASPISKTPSKALRRETYAEIVTKGEVGRVEPCCGKKEVEMEVREVIVKQLKDLAAAFMVANKDEPNAKGEKRTSLTTGEWGVSEESEMESDEGKISTGPQTMEEEEPGDNEQDVQNDSGLKNLPQKSFSSEARETKSGGSVDEICFEEVEMEQKGQRCLEWGESEGSSLGSMSEEEDVPDDVTDVPSELSVVGNTKKQDVEVQAEGPGIDDATATVKTSDADFFPDSETGVQTVTVSTQTSPLPKPQAWPRESQGKNGDSVIFGGFPAPVVPFSPPSTLSHWPTYCGLFMGGLPFKPVPFCQEYPDRWAGNREAQEQQLKFARKCQYIMREEYLERLRSGKACFN